MKIMCFKFHQNRTINEEFDSWEAMGEGGGRVPRFKKYSYRTVVQTQTENFSILAQL